MADQRWCPNCKQLRYVNQWSSCAHCGYSFYVQVPAEKGWTWKRLSSSLQTFASLILFAVCMISEFAPRLFAVASNWLLERLPTAVASIKEAIVSHLGTVPSRMFIGVFCLGAFLAGILVLKIWEYRAYR